MTARERARLRDAIARERLRRELRAERERRGWITLAEWREEVRREKAEIEFVFGDLPRCEQCNRRMAPGVSKKTGDPKRYCSDTCGQRAWHKAHREERKARMRDYYRERAGDWKRRRAA